MGPWALDIKRNTTAFAPFLFLSEVLHKPLDDRMRTLPFSYETVSRSPNVKTDSVVQTLAADHEHVRLDVCLKEAFPSHHPLLRRPFFPLEASPLFFLLRKASQLPAPSLSPARRR